MAIKYQNWWHEEHMVCHSPGIQITKGSFKSWTLARMNMISAQLIKHRTVQSKWRVWLAFYDTGTSVILLLLELLGTCNAAILRHDDTASGSLSAPFAVSRHSRLGCEHNFKHLEVKIANYFLFYLTGRANLNNACQTWLSAVSRGKVALWKIADNLV